MERRKGQTSRIGGHWEGGQEAGHEPGSSSDEADPDNNHSHKNMVTNWWFFPSTFEKMILVFVLHDDNDQVMLLAHYLTIYVNYRTHCSAILKKLLLTALTGVNMTRKTRVVSTQLTLSHTD